MTATEATAKAIKQVLMRGPKKENSLSVELGRADPGCALLHIVITKTNQSMCGIKRTDWVRAVKAERGDYVCPACKSAINAIKHT